MDVETTLCAVRVQVFFNRSFFLQITGYVVTNHFTAITTIIKKCFAKFFVVNSNLIHRGGIMYPRMQRFPFYTVHYHIGLFQKKIVPPVLRISIFLKFTPWISSQIYRDPPGVFGLPPGIPTTFSLPPGIFH